MTPLMGRATQGLPEAENIPAAGATGGWREGMAVSATWEDMALERSR